MLFRSFFFAFALCLMACQPEQLEQKEAPALQKDTSIKYAKRFVISRGKNFKLLYVFGDRNNHDTTATFLISPDPEQAGKLPSHVTVVKSPCQRIAALSSIYATMFCELGAGKSLIAID